MPLALNTVVAVPERRTAIYKITEVLNDSRTYKIKRCLRQAGYPLAGDRTTYVIPFDHAGIRVIVHGATQQREAPATESPNGDLPSRTIDALEGSRFFPKCITDCYRMLESQLSPENLTCDGELSQRQVDERRSKIIRFKQAIDKYVGFNVSINV